jgi:hypothetical protein
MPRGYGNSVFINCPFDPEYRPLFEAVTFCVYDCGFFPRCALEVDDGSQVRIEKITSIIRGSRLSIHDISRTELDAVNGLPRFNMPLELGMVLGAKAFGDRPQRRKAALILDTEPFRYQKYISDIAGQDIRAHGGLVERAIAVVRDFLLSHAPSGVLLPGGHRIVERYQRFEQELPDACARLHLDRSALTFGDTTRLIVGWIRS